MNPLLIILAILVILAFLVMSVYNGLVTMRNRVKNAYSQMDVQMKNRADLIPPLVETVKGSAGHERGTLEAVIKARQQVVNATTPEEAMEANNQLSGALSRLMVVVEQYPDLKANANFQKLMDELKDAEEKIRYSRQFYNDTVQNYNTRIQVFPANIIAGMFGFAAERFFEISESERRAPGVDFSGMYNNSGYGNPNNVQNNEVDPNSTMSSPNLSGIQNNMGSRNYENPGALPRNNSTSVNPDSGINNVSPRQNPINDMDNNPSLKENPYGMPLNPADKPADKIDDNGSLETHSNNPNDPTTKL